MQSWFGGFFSLENENENENGVLDTCTYVVLMYGTTRLGAVAVAVAVGDELKYIYLSIHPSIHPITR